jgi:chromosome segregation ATPase
MQLEEAASRSGAADLQRRTELAEEKFRQAEERSISLSHEVDRLKENVETLQDTVSSLERTKREDARGREDAHDTITRLKATVDRINDELQRYVQHSHAVLPTQYAHVYCLTCLQRAF